MYNEEELVKRIEDLESRIATLEGECEECDDDKVCPECGEEPCVCDETEVETDDKIDNSDVDEVEELDFEIPAFTSTETDDDAEVEADVEEDEEESPYFG